MKRKILAVFAHPDDEAFGPAGTLVKYAAEGTEIHLLCATKGEVGQWYHKDKSLKDKEKRLDKIKLENVREKELLFSAKTLGIKKVEFLGFIDGELRNNIYHKVAEKIIKKIEDFQPQIVVTVERRGVSGHLDHIAISMITTYSFLKTKMAKKLYYHCLPEKYRDKMMDEYFVYFPEGYKENEITTRIDYSEYFDKKVASMQAHQSQIADVNNLLFRFKKWPKVDHFILQYVNGLTPQVPETDLFSGIKV